MRTHYHIEPASNEPVSIWEHIAVLTQCRSTWEHITVLSQWAMSLSIWEHITVLSQHRPMSTWEQIAILGQHKSTSSTWEHITILSQPQWANKHMQTHYCIKPSRGAHKNVLLYWASTGQWLPMSTWEQITILSQHRGTWECITILS